MMRHRAIQWVREHAGLWTLGILILGILGLQGGIGHWALNLHDEKLTSQLQSEVKKLDGRIDGTKELLVRLSRQIARMDGKIDKLAENMDRKLEQLNAKFEQRFEQVDGKFEQVDGKIDRLAVTLGARIDGLAGTLGARIDGLTGRMDKVLERPPAR